jgi:cAMP-dependent protein kinase regulator
MATTSKVEAELQAYVTEKDLNRIFVACIEQMLMDKPTNPYQYVVDYFVKNYPEHVTVGGGVPSNVTSAAAAMGISAPADENGDETDSEDDEDDWVDELPAYTPVDVVAGGGGRRRTAVSAASTDPAQLKAQFEAQGKVEIAKTPAETERLSELLKANIMFGHLDAEQMAMVIARFEPRTYSAGDEIITEGALNGDLFFLLDSGTATVYKTVDGTRKQVFEYEPGASFGELALMYNAPRAATITASSPCKVFALDRLTFKVVLMESTKAKRGLYEGFLAGVDLLHSLNAYERSTIADALSEVKFSAGETIITQGEPGNDFYIIKSGSVTCFKDGNKVLEIDQGGYFGEIALLMSKPRQATVKATGDVELLVLDRKTFTRVMGPLTDILKRDMARYGKVMGQQI